MFAISYAQVQQYEEPIRQYNNELAANLRWCAWLRDQNNLMATKFAQTKQANSAHKQPHKEYRPEAWSRYGDKKSGFTGPLSCDFEWGGSVHGRECIVAKWRCCLRLGDELFFDIHTYENPMKSRYVLAGTVQNKEVPSEVLG